MPSSMEELSGVTHASVGPGSGPNFRLQNQHLSYPPPLTDGCAGCNAVDVPLLACDDLDGASGNQEVSPPIGDPSQRSRFCPNCMIGKKVRVFWPVDNSWYIGTVQQFDASTGEHLLKYEDDDTEWVQIGESNTTMNPPQASTLQQQPALGPGIDSPHETGSSLLLENTDTNTNTNTNTTISATESADIEQKVAPLGKSMSISQSIENSTAIANEAISTEVPSSTYRTYGSVSVTGSSYPSSGQHHLPPHLTNSLTHHQQHNGYFHTSGGPPPPPSSSSSSSMYVGPGGFSSSSSSHRHGSPPPPPSSSSLSYGYPGHHSMTGPQRHGSNASSGPSHHHYGGIHGSPHQLENTPSIDISGPSGSGGNNSKRKTGPKAWTKEEDALLLSIVQSMRVPMKWSLVAQNLPERTGKQCRERYVNHLNPRLKVTDWSPTEDATIFHLFNTIGSHWAKMSKIIPGRTDNGIKNRFHNLRRQLEREDEHRLRLSAARDFPEEIRLELLREFPKELRGKAAELWDIKSGLSVLAAQSILGGGMTRTSGRFGPFREAEVGVETCVRCGFILPSVQTGIDICTKTGWCQSCARIPPHVSGNMLRECLNLRRCQKVEKRKIIESWELPSSSSTENTDKSVQ